MRGVECKSAGRWGSKIYGDTIAAPLPDYCLAQNCHYMSGLDVDRWDLAALLNTNDFRIYVTRRDQELEDYLLEECERFWNYVQRRELPPADGSEAFATYLKERFTKTTGELRPPTDVADDMAYKLRTLQGMRRFVDKRIGLVTQKLQLEIADADGIETAEGTIAFKHHKGRISTKKLAQHLADKLKLSEGEFNSEAELFRGKPPRVFSTPREWLKDKRPTKETVRESPVNA